MEVLELSRKAGRNGPRSADFIQDKGSLRRSFKKVSEMTKHVFLNTHISYTATMGKTGSQGAVENL